MVYKLANILINKMSTGSVQVISQGEMIRNYLTSKDKSNIIFVGGIVLIDEAYSLSEINSTGPEFSTGILDQVKQYFDDNQHPPDRG